MHIRIYSWQFGLLHSVLSETSLVSHLLSALCLTEQSRLHVVPRHTLNQLLRLRIRLKGFLQRSLMHREHMRWNFYHYSYTKGHCNYVIKYGKEKWNVEFEQYDVREETSHSPRFPPGRPHGGSTSPQQRSSDHRRENLLQHCNVHWGFNSTDDLLKSLECVCFSQRREELTVMLCGSGLVMFSDVCSCVIHVVSLPVSCPLMPFNVTVWSL